MLTNDPHRYFTLARILRNAIKLAVFLGALAVAFLLGMKAGVM